MADSASLATSPNWAPAFAGVDVSLADVSAKCFPAEAGTQTGLPPSRENK